MSTSYRVFPELPFRKLLDSLPEGVTIAPNPPDQKDDPNARWLTDGTNFVMASTGDGTDTGFERYGGSNPHDIFDAIAEKFDVEFVDEHDDRFWEGFEDDEEFAEGGDEATGGQGENHGTK